MVANMQWFIGCSGFHYKEWKGKFYPEKLPQTKWLNYYCNHFNTLELNSTFYRFPQISFLEKWYNKTPDNFLFSVKAPKLITHYKQFENSDQELKDFYGTIQEGLKNKLGCVLFQFPASLAFSDDKLDKIVNGMDDSFDNVLEFRNISWWNEKVFSALKKKKTIFCGVSINNLPGDPVIISDTMYYRFHGVPKLYYSLYEEKEIKKVADAITNTKKINRAFVYFNNTASMAAIENARWLQEYTNLPYQHVGTAQMTLFPHL
jgi:uncharacterized protein YecE (DUF72 family)